MELAAEAQAVTVQEFGPLAPIKMLTCPDAMSGIIMGTKNGEIRPGPLLRRVMGVFFQNFQPPDARTDPNPDPFRTVSLDVQPGVFHGKAAGGYRELGESAHSPRIFAVHETP